MSARAEALSTRAGAVRTALAWTAVFVGGLAAGAAFAPIANVALGALHLPVRWPFSRVFDRVAMAAALVALIVCRRWTGWSQLAPLLRRGPAVERGAEVVAGLAAALAGVGLGVAWAVAHGRLGPPEVPIDLVTNRSLSTLFGALVAASIEEVYFRGLLLGSLAERLRWPTAAALASALYAATHLLASDSGFAVRGLEPTAGFRYLAHALTRQLEPAALPPLGGLFLAGLVLALVVRRSGSLFLAIGLHAGWAASFQILRRASRVLGEIPGSSFLATHHYLIGTPWAWAAIALAGALVLAGLALVQRHRTQVRRAATT